MRLKFAILATAADISPDGKISMVGGDVGYILVPALPALHPSLAVIAKLYAAPAEQGQQQVVDFRLIAPNGEILGGTQVTVTPVANQVSEGEDSEVGLITTFVLIPLSRPGRYWVQITSGEQALGEAPFTVILRLPEQTGGTAL